MGRSFEEVNFYLRQLLTGHYHFKNSLHKVRRVRTPDCVLCGHDKSDAEYIFSVCSPTLGEREENARIEPGNSIDSLIYYQGKLEPSPKTYRYVKTG